MFNFSKFVILQENQMIKIECKIKKTDVSNEQDNIKTTYFTMDDKEIRFVKRTITK